MNALVLPETFQHLLSREMQFFAGAAESAAVSKIFNGTARVITFDDEDCGCWLQTASLKYMYVYLQQLLRATLYIPISISI